MRSDTLRSWMWATLFALLIAVMAFTRLMAQSGPFDPGVNAMVSRHPVAELSALNDLVVFKHR